jgi:uncharacterized phage protein (TIGR01671 family)
MKTLKFRGKNVNGGEWVYGALQHSYNDCVCIFNHDKSPYQFGVVPETVGQSTGLYDANGVEIFEGDILRSGSILDFEVYWNQEKASYCTKNGIAPDGSFLLCDVFMFYSDAVVVGSIHDDPNLLKQS